jgi:ADP-ribose pyrophosphatase YjhB (NUDIX family)
MAPDAATDPRLAAFFADLMPVGSQRERWPSGIVLDLSAYVTDRMPPPDLVSGVRAILRRGDAVLAFEEPLEGTHILPGGQLEGAEAPLDGLARELREETGCTISGEARYLGVLRFHHVTPRHEGYRYPYPEFLQLLYVVDTNDDAVEGADEPWVRRPRFVPLAEADRLPLSRAERGLLTVL